MKQLANHPFSRFLRTFPFPHIFKENPNSNKPQIAPLLFDTIVTTMTVIRAFNIRRHSGGSSSRLIQTFLREGVFYYIMISIANLVSFSLLCGGLKDLIFCFCF